jgi:hypothetical protein
LRTVDEAQNVLAFGAVVEVVCAEASPIHSNSNSGAGNNCGGRLLYH